MVLIKKKVFLLIICFSFILNLYIMALASNDLIKKPTQLFIENNIAPNDSITFFSTTKNILVSLKAIIINNNSEFLVIAQAEHWNGNGTKTNPFIIENYDIHINNSQFGIFINSTTENFIIEDCLLTVTGTNSTLIYLKSTENGIILNNLLSNTNFSINNNNTGIYSSDSQNIIIKDNNITNLTNGIYLDTTTSSKFFNNKIFQNVNGVYEIQSNNNIFANNNISFNSLMGIYAYMSNGEIIQTNILANNSFGINFYNTYNNTCYVNILQKNTYGTIIDDSQTDNFFNNTIINSQSYGVFLFSSNNNAIYYNSFIDNNLRSISKKQAFDNSNTDNWTNGVIGNYWNTFKSTDVNHDNIWDTSYTLDGGADAKDQLPLVKSSVNFTLSIMKISDVNYQLAIKGYALKWIIKNIYPPNNYTILRNGLKIASGSWTSGFPVVISINNLSSGTYNYTILVSDKFGNKAASSVKVEILSCNLILNFKLSLNDQNLLNFLNQISFLGLKQSIFGIIIYLLKKYWLEIIIAFISITAILYHPYRKLDIIEVTNHPYRKRIMNILHEKAEEGITLNELAKIISIAKPTLIWHLEMLRDFDINTSFKILREIILIAKDYVQVFDFHAKELELIFKKKQNKKLYDFLNNLETGDSFDLDSVFKQTNWNKKTIQRHIRHLVNIKILLKDTPINNYKINPKYYSNIKNLKN